MYIRMLIFLEVIMKEFKDYFSKSEIVLWSSSVMVMYCEKKKFRQRLG